LNTRVTNFKKQHGPALLEAGFALVPIMKGEKHPKTKGWQNIEVDEESLNKWIKNSYYGGLGCLGKVTPGIDIDVRDADLVEKLVTWVYKNIGVAPVRTGNAPRVLIPCQAPEGGLGPDASKKFEDELGDTHQIEIKATGQQWVAYGIHPDTGNAYTWEGGELHSYDVDLLPELTGEKISALFEYFYSIVPTDWEVKSAGRTRKPKGGFDAMGNLVEVDPFENYSPPLNVSADDIERMIGALDPDAGHDVWLSVGMALYHQFEGSDEGLDMFIRWSMDSIDFDANEIRGRWPTWEAKSYGGSPVTAASIIAMYNEVSDKRSEDDPTLRKKSKKLSEWVKRFALVELKDGTEVHDCGVPLHRSPRRTLKAFREHNAAYIHTYITFDGEPKTEAMVDAWRASLDTRHYAGYIYNPGAGRFCANPAAIDDDSQYVNTFYFPPHYDDSSAKEDLEEVIKPFTDFIAHLFPETVERDWFIMWVARLLQYPSTRSFVTPLNITPVTGTGRGLLFEILKQVVGNNNAHDVSSDDMEGRFNGYLDKCILAVVQEIKAATGDRKYQSWERMKSLLADTSANIQQKGVDSYTAPIYANFLMFSNNLDALPIDDVNERRVYVMRGASKPISNTMIEIVNNWRSESDNIAALFWYLKRFVRVDQSAFKRAPVSEMKRQLVSASLGEDADTLVSWLSEDAPRVFTYDYAIGDLQEYAGSAADFDAYSMNTRFFGRLLADRGYHGKQIRIASGQRVRVWYNPNEVEGDPAILKTIVNQKKLVPEDLPF
jgi:hypothetical protein